MVSNISDPIKAVEPPDSAIRRLAAAREPIGEPSFWGQIGKTLLRRLGGDEGEMDENACPTDQHGRASLELFCDVHPGHERPLFRKFSSVEEVDKWIDSDNYG